MQIEINQHTAFNVVITDNEVSVTKIVHSKAYTITAPWSLTALASLLAMLDDEFVMFSNIQKDHNKEDKYV